MPMVEFTFRAATPPPDSPDEKHKQKDVPWPPIPYGDDLSYPPQYFFDRPRHTLTSKMVAQIPSDSVFLNLRELVLVEVDRRFPELNAPSLKSLEIFTTNNVMDIHELLYQHENLERLQIIKLSPAFNMSTAQGMDPQHYAINTLESASTDGYWTIDQGLHPVGYIHDSLTHLMIPIETVKSLALTSFPELQEVTITGNEQDTAHSEEAHSLLLSAPKLKQISISTHLSTSWMISGFPELTNFYADNIEVLEVVHCQKLEVIAIGSLNSTVETIALFGDQPALRYLQYGSRYVGDTLSQLVRHQTSTDLPDDIVININDAVQDERSLWTPLFTAEVEYQSVVEIHPFIQYRYSEGSTYALL